MHVFVGIRHIHAEAAGSEAYFAEANNTEARRSGREVRLAAERLMGRWLADLETATLRYMGRPAKGTKIGTPHDPELITLEDLGIDRHESQRWQALAKLTAEEFAAFVASDKPTSALIQQLLEKRVLPLSAIRVDGNVQPRKYLHDDRVAEYAEDMRRGDKFPPLVVFEDPEGVCWLADGFHRYHAAAKLKLEAIECDVRPGGLREAILYACGSNFAHGFRRTNADKEQAVTRLLMDTEWGKWSDREIARRCNVGADMVGRVRGQLRPQGHTVVNDSMNSPSHTGERTFTHPKTGKPAQMNTANIGGKPSPHRLTESQREASRRAMRTGAEAMGIPFPAPSTVPPEHQSEPTPPRRPSTPAPAQSDMFAKQAVATPAPQSQQALSDHERWRRQFEAFATIASNLVETWDRDFPGWEKFERPEDFPVLAGIAASNWAMAAARMGEQADAAA